MAFKLLTSSLFVALGTYAHAEVLSMSNYGTPGLLDMPTAQSEPDAELSTTIAYSPSALRNTLSFQITPRLSGSFRYSLLRGNSNIRTLYDRSFDLRYRLLDERKYLPAVAIGLQDFIGTGAYSAEYIVATKHLSSNVTMTGGIGWGRLGTAGGFANPFGALSPSFNTREQSFSQTGALNFDGTGGLIESAKWFRGNAALFGGIAWQVTPKITLKAEYSSDAYNTETIRGNIRQQSPFNFGVDYQIANGINFQAMYMHGTQLGAALSFRLNPKRPSVVGGTDKAPQPVRARFTANAADLGWTTVQNGQIQLRNAAADILALDGLELEALFVGPTRATVRVRASRFRAAAQTVGRTARSLTRVIPASVEIFDIEIVTKGIPVSRVTLQRSALEQLENQPNGSELIRKSAKITDPAAAPRQKLTYGEGLYPSFDWGIGPYFSTSYFDPDSPIRAEVGIEASAAFTLRPGLVLAGSIRKRAAGNKHTSTRVSDSVLQRVRTDGPIYDRQGDPTIDRLTMSYYFRPGNNLYGKLSVGYLETMYGGVSSELLWKPVDSRLALGAELNYVKQRDFDQLFGFQAYEATTGHLTAYYDLGNGFYAEGSVGQYLGGDQGGTLKVERVFKNGWRVGAYATLTNISFADFGEGSFDKGLTFTVPLDHFFGTQKKRVVSTVIQPLTRDGGAKLSLDGRLYRTIEDSQGTALVNTWGRFWR